MKKLYTFLILGFALSLISFGQDLPIIWQNTIGGSDDDRLYCMNKTADGGFILGGRSRSDISGDKTENSIGIGDYWVVKVNSNGLIEWQNTIGGSLDDHLYSISQTSDGGYILGGISNSNISGDKSENAMGIMDYWVVKINAFGSIEWENTIGGNGVDYMYSIEESLDGGYILGGKSNSNISGDKTENSLGEDDIWVIKINESGIIQWDNTIGGDSYDNLESLSVTTDGGYILGGSSSSGISGDKTEGNIGSSDFWVIKLTNNGNIEWQNTIGGTEGDWIEHISQTSDGGYIIGGGSTSNISGDKTENSNGGFDMWVVKLDSSGLILWQNTIGGNDQDMLESIRETSGGGYIIAGGSQSNISGDKDENTIGDSDYWILKLNAFGAIEGQNTIGGTGAEGAYSAIETADEGYFVAGFSNSDISGDKIENSQGGYDFWILKLDNILEVTENDFSNTLNLHPNPAKNTIRITLKNQTIDVVKIYSVKGELLKVLKNFENSSPIDVSYLASGVYYLQLTSGKSIATKKFVKE
ncbi:MAG: T9SS type A sorting domain-containing protein [Altibacter sp.]|uniref:T9SS type A sorting domain-containing protein n=1 Tax=Altibacter sp. TaxID=2024823 RepID=UPI001DD20ACB|nr:T9SS type A sorting domain-containing protein [Altibacter sp.]MBZ0328526.1 T9SS type A sorting domain-containing protein [Altibacter sp.]